MDAMKLGLLAIVSVSLVACCNPPADTFCAVAKPIYLTKDDVLAQSTLREVIGANETWEKLCKK